MEIQVRGDVYNVQANPIIINLKTNICMYTLNTIPQAKKKA